MKKKIKYLFLSFVIILIIFVVFCVMIRKVNSDEIKQIFTQNNTKIHVRTGGTIKFNLSLNMNDVFYVPITGDLIKLKFNVFGTTDSGDLVYFFDGYSYEEIDNWENMDKLCNDNSCLPRFLNISDYYSGEISVYAKTSIFGIKEYREINLENSISKYDKKSFILDFSNVNYRNRYDIKLFNKHHFSGNIKRLSYPKGKIEGIYIVLTHSSGEKNNTDAEFSIIDTINKAQ